MKKIAYSVIIPVYNGEKTIKRCLNRLLEQEREDVQIILVSDGSTDGTDAIARGYGDRIEYYVQPHAGVSAARNLGLNHAKGEFVLFVDSDDYVSADYFARLDREEDCDLLVFGLEPPLLGHLASADREGRLEWLLRSRKIMPPFGKRFRRAVLEESGLRFIEGLQVGEDFCFCYLFALESATIGVSGACTYYEDVSNGSSLSRRYRPWLMEDLCLVFTIVKQPGKHLPALDYLYARHALSCIAEVFKDRDLHPVRDRAEIRRICDCFREPIGPCRGIIHRLLRFLLGIRADTLLYCIAYWGKGRKFRQCRKKC